MKKQSWYRAEIMNRFMDENEMETFNVKYNGAKKLRIAIKAIEQKSILKRLLG